MSNECVKCTSVLFGTVKHVDVNMPSIYFHTYIETNRNAYLAEHNELY